MIERSHIAEIPLAPPPDAELVRRARRTVAGQATGVGDARTLLAMLGLLDDAAADAHRREHRPVCVGCGRPMVAARYLGRVPQGCVRRAGGGRCASCYGAPVTEPPAAVVVADPVPQPGGPGPRRPGQRCARRARDLDFQVRVARLREVEGRSWVAIAAELGCAAATARAAFAQVRVEMPAGGVAWTAR
jgi:hypothetical protein